VDAARESVVAIAKGFFHAVWLSNTGSISEQALLWDFPASARFDGRQIWRHWRCWPAVDRPPNLGVSEIQLDGIRWEGHGKEQHRRDTQRKAPWTDGDLFVQGRWMLQPNEEERQREE